MSKITFRGLSIAVTKTTPAVHVGAALLVSMQLTACTVIGGTVGALSSTSSKSIQSWELSELKVGSKVVLRMKNDSTIEMRYRGTSVLPESRYAPLYKDWLQGRTDAEEYPEFASNVTVVPKTGYAKAGAFGGVGVDRLFIGDGPGMKEMLLSNVRLLINDSGQTLTGDQISDEVWKAGAPLRRSYRFGDGESLTDIDPRDIRDVYVYGRSYVAHGIVTGLVIDAVVVAAASSLLLYSFLNNLSGD